MEIEQRINGIVASNMQYIYRQEIDDVLVYMDKITTIYKIKIASSNSDKSISRYSEYLIDLKDNYDIFYKKVCNWIDQAHEPSFYLKRSNKNGF